MCFEEELAELAAEIIYNLMLKTQDVEFSLEVKNIVLKKEKTPLQLLYFLYTKNINYDDRGEITHLYKELW